MSTSIRISKETKQKLEVVKRDDETFDELLARLVATRTEEEVREMAGFGGDGVDEAMKEAREELNESLEQRANR
ncbi:hypothetical protein BRD09_04020 [Halobacteriales archaeon SW_10_68_16]|jgi:predicted CopG family antitoxin|nr:MAG: hypothetical protein BRD09_04020 [Halobacteriales archaeon SW_10_68_16]